MTRASIYITDHAGHGVWLFRGADGYPTGQLDTDLRDLRADLIRLEIVPTGDAVVDFLLSQRYPDDTSVYERDSAPHRSSTVDYIYAVRLHNTAVYWRHWDARGRDRQRIGEIARSWAWELPRARLFAAANRQFAYARENREIAARLQASEYAQVRRLADTYIETARRHDECAVILENEASGRETAPGQGEGNRG